MAEAEVGVMQLLAWKTEKGRKPRGVGSLQKLEKARNGFSREPPGASSGSEVMPTPCDTFDSQDCQVIHLYR